MTDTERCRKIIGALFQAGVFAVKGGEACLNFDKDGELGTIRINSVRWTRNVDISTLQPPPQNVSIELQK